MQTTVLVIHLNFDTIWKQSLLNSYHILMQYQIYQELMLQILSKISRRLRQQFKLNQNSRILNSLNLFNSWNLWNPSMESVYLVSVTWNNFVPAQDIQMRSEKKYQSVKKLSSRQVWKCSQNTKLSLYPSWNIILERRKQLDSLSNYIVLFYTLLLQCCWKMGIKFF